MQKTKEELFNNFNRHKLQFRRFSPPFLPALINFNQILIAEKLKKDYKKDLILVGGQVGFLLVILKWN
jgi:hypothetical protein